MVDFLFLILKWIVPQCIREGAAQHGSALQRVNLFPCLSLPYVFELGTLGPWYSVCTLITKHHRSTTGLKAAVSYFFVTYATIWQMSLKKVSWGITPVSMTALDSVNNREGLSKKLAPGQLPVISHIWICCLVCWHVFEVFFWEMCGFNEGKAV